jgi:hypothetical protein
MAGHPGTPFAPDLLASHPVRMHRPLVSGIFLADRCGSVHRTAFPSCPLVSFLLAPPRSRPAILVRSGDLPGKYARGSARCTVRGLGPRRSLNSSAAAGQVDPGGRTQWVLDCVYTPVETELIKAARGRGLVRTAVPPGPSSASVRPQQLS